MEFRMEMRLALTAEDLIVLRVLKHVTMAFRIKMKLILTVAVFALPALPVMMAFRMEMRPVSIAEDRIALLVLKHVTMAFRIKMKLMSTVAVFALPVLLDVLLLAKVAILMRTAAVTIARAGLGLRLANKQCTFSLGRGSIADTFLYVGNLLCDTVFWSVLLQGKVFICRQVSFWSPN